MVRTHGFMAYEIWNEYGKLKVYPDRDDYGTAIKSGDGFYMIMFAHGINRNEQVLKINGKEKNFEAHSNQQTKDRG